MKKIKKLFRNCFLLLLLIGGIILGYVFFDGYFLYNEVTTKTPLSNKVSSIKEKNDYLEYDEIPTMFVDAIVCVEDHRFFKHNGFDVISFTRAMLKNVEEKSMSQGGSTLTQQLAKNMYFSFEKKISRKIAELFVTIDLEKNYSKEEILALYTNSVYYGDGFYGLNAASHGYFNKDVDSLTEDEITLLAGLPNAPSAYALKEHEDLARKRQEVVIECLNNFKDEIK